LSRNLPNLQVIVNSLEGKSSKIQRFQITKKRVFNQLNRWWTWIDTRYSCFSSNHLTQNPRNIAGILPSGPDAFSFELLLNWIETIRRAYDD